DGSGDGVYATRYNAAGQELPPPAGVPRGEGNEFRVNTTTAGNQALDSVAMDAAGDLVVAWQNEIGDSRSFDVYAQRYDFSGAARGTEFRVNTTTDGDQREAALAMD